MGLIWRVFLRVGAKAGDCGNAFLGFVEGYSGTKCGCGTPFYLCKLLMGFNFVSCRRNPLFILFFYVMS
jgi:hypothetical protein